ncbi:MAG: transketolase [Parvularculaceae bacterium]
MNVDEKERVTTRQMANAIRALSMDAVQKANSGHPGMPMGMADVATVLFTEFLKFDAADPEWPDRDRFILSAGHGSMLLYSLLYLTGSPDIGVEDLKKFRQLGAKTAGHPEYGHARGVETTTGPLGQGIANAVGMALAERLANARAGDTAVDHFTYVIAGDGCLMEGISHEAIDFAGRLGLSKLIVFWDDNSITIDGETHISTATDQLKRFEAAGWEVAAIDGHDAAAIRKAIEAAKKSDKPSIIAAKTIIGYGAPNKQGTEETHGAPLGDEEIAATRKSLDWPHAPFEVPQDILSAWREAGAKGAAANADWKKRNPNYAASPDLSGLGGAVAALKEKLAADKPKIATRKASQVALDAIAPSVPAMIGGSADLTGSNLTKAKSQKSVAPGEFDGSYVHYGVREHGMAAAMNGVALHGEFIPYGGTFLVFADYCRPSIRMSALMGKRVIYVMTHDSIGLGEDGPTHQPVEHLASLRSMPNVDVIRPADAMETAEAWECALLNEDGPTVLALSRQGLPALREKANKENLVAKGAYVIREAKGPRKATFIATGSEVSLAVAAAELLGEAGLEIAVVSAPSLERFGAQSAAYKKSVLGDAPRIAIEAGASFGWERWTGEDGFFIGVDTFGASGPGGAVYEHFGLTPEAIAKKTRAHLARIGGV